MKDMYFLMRVFDADWTKSLSERRVCLFEFSTPSIEILEGVARSWREESDRYVVYITSEEIG
jgi:hypothetical protein